MILVTGATGFVGRRVLPMLVGGGEQVRILLRPRRASPKLPRGTEFEVALASLSDRRGVRAAMVGVDKVIHLASAESLGRPAALSAVDVDGTENLALAASEVGVEHFIYLSHLGASASSAYPLLRAKAAAEQRIRRAGIPHLVLRSGPLFGPDDRFTCALAKLMAISPGLLPLPGDGSVRLQPLWVEDLTTALEWILGGAEAPQGTHEVGGPEHLPLAEIVELVREAAGLRRRALPLRPPYLRSALWLLQHLLPRPPATTFGLDYLAAHRMAPLDSMTRLVGLQPARMEGRLDYLSGVSWLRRFLGEQWRGRSIDGS